MKRTGAILILLLWIPLLGFSMGEEEAVDEILEEYTDFYGSIFTDGMESIVGEEAGEYLPVTDARKMLKDLVRGELSFSPTELLRAVVRGLLGEVYDSMRLLVLVLAASLLCSYLTGMSEGAGGQGVSVAAYYACYLVIAGMAATAFYETAECVGQAMQNISLFMEIVVPVVITTLITSGAILSASVFEPMLLAVVEIALGVIRQIFIPVVMVTTALSLVNGISDGFKVDRLIRFLHQCVKWGLSVLLTVFVSMAGLQSIASGGADGLTVKLTKFATSNLIPVVGGILAETVETVMNCSVLIKNSVGILGILCLIIIVLTPLLKVAAILILFRLTAAVAEPVSEPKVILCLSRLADGISVLFSMLAAVTVMFVLILTVMIHAGSAAVLLGR